MSFSEFEVKFHQVLANPDFVCKEPEVSKVWGEYGDYQLVGHGEKTNEHCGEYIGLRGCTNVEAHDVVTMDNVNHRGKVPISVNFRWCHRASCPTCFEKGWAFRESKRAEARLLEGAKQYGLVEHLSVSPSPSLYCLSLEVLRKKAVKALEARGVIGGNLIPHAFRYHSRREARLKGGLAGWYFSMHIHCLGYIQGGFNRCRCCKHFPHDGDKAEVCMNCDGFEGRTRRHWKEDGFIVKVARDREGVAGVRKSVFKTLSYQLSHCSIKKSAKRATAVTWFGVISTRKMKFKYLPHHEGCPICKGEMKPVLYVGSRRIVKDRRSPDFVPRVEVDFEENGVPVVIEKECDRFGRYGYHSSGYGGGGYEE